MVVEVVEEEQSPRPTVVEEVEEELALWVRSGQLQVVLVEILVQNPPRLREGQVQMEEQALLGVHLNMGVREVEEQLPQRRLLKVVVQYTAQVEVVLVEDILQETLLFQAKMVVFQGHIQ
jgi:hypothetical protein